MLENIAMEGKLNGYAQRLCSNEKVLGWRYTVAKYYNCMWPEKDEAENLSQARLWDTFQVLTLPTFCS